MNTARTNIYISDEARALLSALGAATTGKPTMAGGLAELIARTERPNAYCPRPTVIVTFVAPEFKSSMWDALIANMPAEKGYTAQLGFETETAAEARRLNAEAILIRDQWKPKNWAKLDALTQGAQS